MSLEYSKQLNFMKNAYKKLRSEYDKINMIAVNQQDEILNFKQQTEIIKKQKDTEKKKLEKILEIEKELGLDAFLYTNENFYPKKSEFLKNENLKLILTKEEIDSFLNYEKNILELNKKIDDLNRSDEILKISKKLRF
jgi:anion-transporting  ArsA/GET3 family ATPase